MHDRRYIFKPLYFFISSQKINQFTMQQNEQIFDLYDSYPLCYFQSYKKITNSSHYKASTYQHMQTTLTQFVEIFIEFLLLLIQTSRKQVPLYIAVSPGIFYGQKVHFYTQSSKGEKGFTKINDNQNSSQIKKILIQLMRMNIMDASEQNKANDFQVVVGWLNKYLQQNEVSKQSLSFNIQNHKGLFIINLLASINKQKLMVKYSQFLQKVNYHLSTKIIENSKNLEENRLIRLKNNPSSQHVIQSNVWKDKIQRLHQHFLDLDKSNIVRGLKFQSKVIKIQDDYHGNIMNKNEMIRLRLVVSLFQNYSNEEESIFHESLIKLKDMKVSICSQFVNVELSFNNRQENQFNIYTNTFWMVDKKHFILLETLWMKIQQQWLKISISMNVFPEQVSISKVQLSLNEHGHIQLKQKIKFSSFHSVKTNLICYIDKQTLLQLMIFPYLEAIHRKINSLSYFNEQILSMSEQKFIHLALSLRKWITFLEIKHAKYKKE